MTRAVQTQGVQNWSHCFFPSIGMSLLSSLLGVHHRKLNLWLASLDLTGVHGRPETQSHCMYLLFPARIQMGFRWVLNPEPRAQSQEMAFYSSHRTSGKDRVRGPPKPHISVCVAKWIERDRGFPLHHGIQISPVPVIIWQVKIPRSLLFMVGASSILDTSANWNNNSPS